MQEPSGRSRFVPACLACGLLLAAPQVAGAGFLDALRGVFSRPRMAPEQPLDTETIAAGIREALRVGTERVVARLGRPGGFSTDPVAHIPLPGPLATAQRMLAQVGMSGIADDLEARLNRAAEAALPEAREVFVATISAMTLDDVLAIYRGPEDAATRYFQEKMTPQLVERMTPIVREKLAAVGAVAAYDAVMARYRALPMAPEVDADLSSYVVGKALEATFHYVAAEEAAIRRNPAARTTGLLKKVFGRSR